MRKLVAMALLLCGLVSASGCANTQEGNADSSVSEVAALTDAIEKEAAASAPDEEEALHMKVQIGDSVFTATLEENEAVNTLVAMMEEAPAVIEMNEFRL